MSLKARLNAIEKRARANVGPAEPGVVTLPAEAFDYTEEGRRRLAETYPGKLIVPSLLTPAAWSAMAARLRQTR